MSHTPSISLHVVTWNGMDVFPELCKSLRTQTVQDFRLFIIDNGSSDGIEDFVRAQMPQAVFLRNPKNLGFAAAHNQGIRYAIEHWQEKDLSSCFILIVNQDTIFSPTFVEELLRDTQTHPTVGMWGGTLLRAFREPAGEEGWKETILSDVIDSTGLCASRGCFFWDRGAGEINQGQYRDSQDVFGISGAIAMYRAQALADIRYAQEFFDADFFSYKEDIDLSWRLQRMGWGARFVPGAVAYHHRGMYSKEKLLWWKRWQQRRGQSRIRRYWSLRNHGFLLVKNLGWLEFFAMSPWVIAREFTRFFYVLLFEPRYMKAFIDPWIIFPRLWRKRRLIQRSRRVPRRALLKWFC
ncbi:TPA: hypothetical protein DEP34_02430 [Candidatus Uhrbacteria bacterium]|nr:hypothetical protein [Candidatus Uhrbacteria bacterium]HCB19220.1 hypothetical protein [Candidatus Uhrbacteria bacterium]